MAKSCDRSINSNTFFAEPPKDKLFEFISFPSQPTEIREILIPGEKRRLEFMRGAIEEALKESVSERAASAIINLSRYPASMAFNVLGQYAIDFLKAYHFNGYQALTSAQLRKATGADIATETKLLADAGIIIRQTSTKPRTYDCGPVGKRFLEVALLDG